MILTTDHGALCRVSLDDRLRVLVEGDQPLLNGVHIVISPARSLGTLKKSLSHGLIRHFKIEDVLARSNGLLKLLSLSNLTRIAINQVSLGTTQLLDHGLSKEIKHGGKGHQLAALHDGGEVLASLRARGNLISQEVPRGKVSEAILGHNLITLGTLATPRATKDPDNGQAGGGEGAAVNWLEHKN